MRKVLFFFLIALLPFVSQSQLLYDNATQQLVLQTIDHVYNYEFAEAEVIQKQIKLKYPNHPVNPLLKAVQWQWQYLPVKDNKPMLNQYFQQLQQCIALAKPLEKNERTKFEAAFFLMSAHGYIALVHNYNSETMKAVGEAKKVYNYVIDGLKYMDKNPEFYFSSGLFNYYVERYPKDHPIVKPVMWFFKDGEMETGLRQMDLGVKKGVFTRTEAAFYLARIYMKHEMKFDKAATYTTPLVQKYPNNPVYLMKHAEALVLGGKYAEAAPLIDKIKKRSDKFFPLARYTFEGLTEEKMAKKDKEAAESYQLALKSPYDDEFTKEYHAFAYAGLARIAARAGDRKRAVALYKKALDIAEYEHIIREAKAYLK
jgi:tetratricopeptide (TPR) repeat protein